MLELKILKLKKNTPPKKHKTNKQTKNKKATKQNKKTKKQKTKLLQKEISSTLYLSSALWKQKQRAGKGFLNARWKRDHGPRVSCLCVCVKVLQLCPTLCDPVDCSQPGSSVRGILQAIILEWIVMPSPRGSSQSRERRPIAYISCIGMQALYH